MIAPAAAVFLAGLALIGLSCVDAALNPNWTTADDTPEGEQ